MKKILAVLMMMVGTLWCAGPVLTPDQIRAAILEGAKFKSADKFISEGSKYESKKGLKGITVDISSNTYVTFFNDWQAVALESALAHQQMRELKVEEIHSTGILHGRLTMEPSEMWHAGNEKFVGSHLVIVVGDRVIQPTKEEVIKTANTNRVFVGKGWLITVAVEFDVTPDDLLKSVNVIVIDGNGKKHKKMADLKGVLTVD